MRRSLGPAVLELGREAVLSLLRGIGELPSKLQPFELLNLMAPGLMQGWKGREATSRAQLNLALLGAHYAGGQQLPTGFLWEQESEGCPLETMPNWNNVWQATLFGEKPRLVTEDLDPLSEARRQTVEMLGRDGGRYVCLHSFKSKRHLSLFSEVLLPDLQAKLEQVQTFDRRLFRSCMGENLYKGTSEHYSIVSTVRLADTGDWAKCQWGWRSPLSQLALGV